MWLTDDKIPHKYKPTITYASLYEVASPGNQNESTYTLDLRI